MLYNYSLLDLCAACLQRLKLLPVAAPRTELRLHVAVGNKAVIRQLNTSGNVQVQYETPKDTLRLVCYIDYPQQGSLLLLIECL